MKNVMNGLQSLGRALMLPIAVMPIAGLLLRLGQPDLLDIAFLSAAGEAVFSNLGLLFAVGVAAGYARDGNAAAALASLVCFLVARGGAMSLMQVPSDVLAGQPAANLDVLASAWKSKAVARLDVPIGILSGLAGGAVYNRVIDVQVPSYLAFFGGRRLAPIVCGFVGLLIAVVVGPSFSAVSTGVDALSRGIAYSGPFGAFAYGFLNRLLLVTGLHHILNNIIWFVAGDYHGATGDLRRFFAGDPSAGAFMSGFFPVMMFGLPAACLAMYRSALPERRKEVGGLLLSIGLTSALTGVTEPIEFTFMFVAPLLYAIHAVLTGISMAVMDLLGIRLGFTFSAGLLDYALNFGQATRPLLLLPVGAVYAIIYYTTFRFAIVRFGLATPGREARPQASVTDDHEAATDRGAAFVSAVGGRDNLTSIGACTTRLRLTLVDTSLVDEARLKGLGAIAVLRPSKTALQVVVGPIADTIAGEMQNVSPIAADAVAPIASAELAAPDMPRDEIVRALGGPDNLVSLEIFGRRLRAELVDESQINDAALAGLQWRHHEKLGRYHHILLT